MSTAEDFACEGRPYACYCTNEPVPGTRRCVRCTGVDYPELRDPPARRSVLAVLEVLPPI